MMLARQKVSEELSVISSLEDILHNCEPHEIESIFMLQILEKEETSLLRQLTKHSPNDFGHPQDLYRKCETKEDVEHFFLHMSNDIPVHEKDFELRGKFTKNLHVLDPLVANFERKQQLEDVLSHEARRRLLFFNNLLTEDRKEISLLNQVRSLDEARKLVGASEDQFAMTQDYLKNRN